MGQAPSSPPSQAKRPESVTELANIVSDAVFARPIWGFEEIPHERNEPGSRSVAEVELRALAVAIQEAIGRVASNSAEAAEVLELRLASALHAGRDLSYEAEALRAELGAAAAAKTVALETEAVIVDAALENAVRVRDDAAVMLLPCKVDGSIPSPALPARGALVEMRTRADALTDRLRLLSCVPVELPDLALLAPATATEGPTSASLGVILAPRGSRINPDTGALVLRAGRGGASGLRRWVSPGQRVTADVVLVSEGAMELNPAELSALLAALSARTRARATLSHEGGAGQPSSSVNLSVTCVPDPKTHSVRVATVVPEDAALGALLTFEALTVAGRPVPCARDLPPLPWTMAVARGLVPPFRTPDNSVIAGLVTPAISSAGELFAPDGLQPGVVAFSNTGVKLPDRSFTAGNLGLSGSIYACASFENVMLVAQNSPGKIAAVDVDTREVLWRTNPRTASLSSCYGTAILPLQGIFVATATTDNAAYVHRLDNGERITRAVPPSSVIIYCAADVASGTVYVTTGSSSVYPYTWDAVAQALVAKPSISADFVGSASRPIAVVPAAAHSTGMRQTAHLVVGSNGSKDVRVGGGKDTGGYRPIDWLVLLFVYPRADLLPPRPCPRAQAHL